MFKAAKPTVPPTFDGVDYDDNKALKAAQDSVIREQWVQSMMARLVREELGKCYYREGTNHLEKCGHLRGKTTRLQKDAHMRGGEWALRASGKVLGADDISQLQTGIWSSSSTRRSRVTFSSSRTTCPNKKRVGLEREDKGVYGNVQYATRTTRISNEKLARARGKCFLCCYIKNVRLAQLQVGEKGEGGGSFFARALVCHSSR